MLYPGGQLLWTRNKYPLKEGTPSNYANSVYSGPVNYVCIEPSIENVQGDLYEIDVVILNGPFEFFGFIDRNSESCVESLACFSQSSKFGRRRLHEFRWIVQIDDL